jgi:prepilin-type N-terminal cleavage/methylation domain-containing protein
MCANSTERGFTLPELIAVLVIVGILAVVALPRLQGAVSLRDDAWRDQVVAAMHFAHKSAISHRRLVCATVGSASVALAIASANPATSCSATLTGIDGQAFVAVANGGAAASLAPAGTIYFQPSGQVSADGAGNSVTSWTIGIASLAAIVLVGDTGHVE